MFIKGAPAGHVSHTVADGGIVARLMNFLIGAYKKVPAGLEPPDLLSSHVSLPFPYNYPVTYFSAAAGISPITSHCQSSGILGIQHPRKFIELPRDLEVIQRPTSAGFPRRFIFSLGVHQCFSRSQHLPVICKWSLGP